MSRTLSKFCLPFDQATPAVHFLKAIKRPRNNAGLASVNSGEQVWTGVNRWEFNSIQFNSFITRYNGLSQWTEVLNKTKNKKEKIIKS